MIKSDSTYYNSSSSSTGSDCYSENSKSLDTVTQLFSNLLKNSDTSTNLRCKSPCSAPPSNDHSNLSQSASQRCNDEENNRSTDLITKTQTPDTFQNTKESHDSHQNTKACDQQKPSSCLAASCETVIVEKTKDFSTPFNSKIPVLHARSDPTVFYESDRKTPHNRKLLNPSSLKRINSNSRIPVRSVRKAYFDKSPVEFFKIKNPQRVDNSSRQTQLKKVSDKNYSGKYTHVKSKLAAYIHRPSKIDSRYYSSSSAKSNYKAPVEYKRNRDDYGCTQNVANSSNCLNIRRVESRTSLDTYTCDYKMPLPDFSCLDCYKTDDLSKPHQKAREHLEQAAEHCRMKLENRKIIQEHKRSIVKHRQLALEHEQKANEHELKAIACILNRVT